VSPWEFARSERRTEGSNRGQELLALRLGEVGEGRRHALTTAEVELADLDSTLVGEAERHHATVLGVMLAFHQPALLHAGHDPGCSGKAAAEELGDAAHRQRAVASPGGS